ncbi:hypothetical protein OUZ56_015268 [Daphnia magna]|uniref:Uncharacterized protein n=1 Tax=Daphnia magna TaxID=35525 RepID=A0ABR0AMB9_9CRUS|nr:hypothetical protein OUZ56_015268 [Daphnia magna]
MIYMLEMPTTSIKTNSCSLETRALNLDHRRVIKSRKYPCKRLNLKVEAIADKNIVKIKVTQFHGISYIWTDKDKKINSARPGMLNWLATTSTFTSVAKLAPTKRLREPPGQRQKNREL